VDSEPADGATLPTSPTEMIFTFAERLGNDDTLTAPVACGSVPQRIGVPEVSADRLSVTVEVLAPFPRGACTISWGLRDGLNQQLAGGLITFSVSSSPVSETTAAPTGGGTTTPTNQTSPTGAQDPDSSNGVEGALWFGRVVSTTAILALFGAIALIGLAWPEGTGICADSSVSAIAVACGDGRHRGVCGLECGLCDIDIFWGCAEPSDLAGACRRWLDGSFALVRLVLVIATVWAIWTT
jgi:hypothetical protein